MPNSPDPGTFKPPLTAAQRQSIIGFLYVWHFAGISVPKYSSLNTQSDKNLIAIYTQVRTVADITDGGVSLNPLQGTIDGPGSDQIRGALNSTKDVGEALSSFYNLITSATFWERIGEVAVGGILLAAAARAALERGK